MSSYSPYDGKYDVYGWPCAEPFSDFAMTYWERSLFQRLRTLIKIGGLPEPGPGQVAWDLDALYYGLFRCGFLAVFEVKDWGIVPPQIATRYGYGLQYQPTQMVINSPYFNFPRPLTIGHECAVMKLTPDYQGVWDIITKYGMELQLEEVAIRQALINARFTYVIAAEDEKEAATANAMLERIYNGKPGVVVDKRFAKNGKFDDTSNEEPPWRQFDRDLKKNFLLPELLDARRTTLQDFYREIGIKVMPNKKERMVTQEAQSYDAETFNRRELWISTLAESMDIINRMYGTKLTVELNEPDEVEKEGVSGDALQPDKPGTAGD